MAYPLWQGNPAFIFLRFVIKWAAICRTDYRGPLTEQDMELLSMIRSKIEPGPHHGSIGEQHRESQRKLQQSGWWSTTEAKLLTKIWKMTSVSAEPESDTGLLRTNAHDLSVIINALDELNPSGMTISCETHLHIYRAGRGTTGYPSESDLKDLYKNCLLSLMREKLRHRAMGEAGRDRSESRDSGPQISQVRDTSDSLPIDTAFQDRYRESDFEGDSDDYSENTDDEDPMALDDDSFHVGGHEEMEGIDLPYDDASRSQEDATRQTGHRAILAHREEAVRPSRAEVTNVANETAHIPTQSHTEEADKTTDVEMNEAETVTKMPVESNELGNGRKDVPDRAEGWFPVEAHDEERATKASKRQGDEIEEQPSPKRPRPTPKARKPPAKSTGSGKTDTKPGQLMEQTGGDIDDNFDKSSPIEDQASPKATPQPTETAEPRATATEPKGRRGLSVVTIRLKTDRQK